jgi:hypothetical protein
MITDIVFSDVVEKSSYRRVWLLYKALEIVSLDRAIDLAREADGFVTGAPAARVGASHSAEADDQSSAGDDRAAEGAINALTETTITPREAPTARLRLSTDERQKLLQRLATGATNADLAAEFRLSAKQLQGFRMGAARQIAKQRAGGERPAEETRAASADEVVRYLRQQDDVVVPHTEGKYLVNGRFELSLASLVERANRMRSRQGKTRFELEGSCVLRTHHRGKWSCTEAPRAVLR